MKQSQYEHIFELWLRSKHIKYVKEHKFHPQRKWRFDFVIYPCSHLIMAVEIDGGAWLPNGGRHNSDPDREKLNEAVRLGWAVFRFSGGQVKSGEAMKWMEGMLESVGVNL